jgi:bla regulator protein blaR1
MSSVITQHVAPWLVTRIAEPAIRSLLVAAVAGLALAIFRPRSVSLRLATWTIVLFAALAMPFLGWLLPSVPLRLPAPSAARARTVVAAAQPMAQAPGRNPRTPSDARKGEAESQSLIQPIGASRLREGHAVDRSPFDQAGQQSRKADRNFWPAGLVCLYLLTTTILLARFALGVKLRRRLRASCVGIDDPRTQALICRNARSLRVDRVPQLAESTAVAVPVTLGVRDAAILLPPGWRLWEDAKLSAVLAHELSHIKRRDALTQLLSAVHVCVFWFSPLAWWLDRELAELAEEASDEAALRAGAGATYYAEMLLGFFASLGAARRRVRWEAISLVRGLRVERRLERIFRANPTVPGGLGKPVLFLLLASTVPVVSFLGAVQPLAMQAQSDVPAPAVTPTQAQPAPAPRPPQAKVRSPNEASPAAPPSPAAPNPQFGRTVFPKGVAHRAPPAPAAPPQPASGPLPPPGMLAAGLPLPAPPDVGQGVSASSQNGAGSSFLDGDEGPDYAVVSGRSLFMSGSSGEREEVDALRGKVNGNFIWFRRDAKSYIIQDAGTVTEAALFFQAEQNLGRQQAALGKQQAALGKEQAALGRQMRAVRVQVPEDLVSQLEAVEASIKKLGPTSNQQELGRLQGELGRLQGEIGRLQAYGGRQEGAVGKQMGTLGRQQGELGREQGRLGREQARLARQANREMRRLIDSAFARGLAKPAP